MQLCLAFPEPFFLLGLKFLLQGLHVLFVLGDLLRNMLLNRRFEDFPSLLLLFHSLFDLSSYMSEPQSGGVYTEILMTL